MNIEIIRNTLYKVGSLFSTILFLRKEYFIHYIKHYSVLFQSYLEDFYKFCEELGGATANVMCEALAVRTNNLYKPMYGLNKTYEWCCV